MLLRLAAVLVCLGLAAGCTRPSGPEGKPAPDFEAKTLDGRALSLSGLKGKVVLLDFWATWCGPCEETIPNLVELYRRHRASGLEIVGVSLDDDERDVPAFAAENGMRYPIVVDSEKRLLDSYQVRSVPTTVLVDREGVVRGRWVGAGEEIERELEGKIRELLEAPSPGSGPPSPGSGPPRPS